ncbi:glutamate carboxypeptidase [Rhizoctonia solani AG-1 IA]|uniref:Glutamate carboxypeptidase n=1 Tax=Thanatephorus cucumeris (strain AG1-IA) TaxID=983506 RepID=L8WMQ2_THACA|nr:glutamate carboxypeptidase [Rhizoctonia solani AG-1 IA]
MSAAPEGFLNYVDAHKDAFIKRLADAIAIPSVSGDPSHRPRVKEMGEFVQAQLDAVGVTTKLVELGTQIIEGQKVDLPPVVLGSIGNDKNKKTVLIYAHYDVQPAEQADGWKSDPFKLNHDKTTDRLYGRGSTDDKGPLMAWINVLEAHKASGTELPVNLKMCFEGMEESGSEGLDDLIKAEAGSGKFFHGVDCVCISDNYWLNDTTRGISYFKVTISGPAHNLHSGLYGNCVHEPMTNLVQVFSKLVDSQGKILIPKINELVDKLTPDERTYPSVDIDKAVGASIALSDDKVDVLMGRMRYPSLSIHTIESSFDSTGVESPTIIPATVVVRVRQILAPPGTQHDTVSLLLLLCSSTNPFVLREVVDSIVKRYIEYEFGLLNSKCKLTVEALSGGKPYLTDPNHWNFVAASNATQAIYGKEPNLTREGGSIPVTLTFADALNVNVLLLPMGRGSDGAHSTNEKLDLSNYINGVSIPYMDPLDS